MARMERAAARPTTPPHGAMQRGRRRRGNLEDHPALANRYVCRKAPFQRTNCPPNSSGRIEPFLFRPDKTLPGTLHHSGNRPAPPSDHIPLARRSAFQRGWRGNSDARPGLERIQHEDSDVPGGNLPADGKWNFVVPLPLLRRSASGNFDLIRSAKTEARLALIGRASR
jgi:hypothetical protein